MSSIRLVVKATKYTATIVFPLAIAGSYYHRPSADIENGDWGGPSHYPPKQASRKDVENMNFFTAHEKKYNMSVLRKRISQKNVVKLETTENRLENDINIFPQNGTATQMFEPLLQFGYEISRYMTVSAVNVIIYLGMNYYNKFHLVKNDNYHQLIKMIQETNELKNASLLTVSNHCSTIDDPTLFGAMLPPSIALNPSKLRWTLCSQEICFKKPILAAIFGSGNVLPIKRGAGINQPLLLNFAKKIAEGGQWVHVFPEGKIIQSGDVGENYFGTRSKEKAESIGGRLKWGVGKLIAHSPIEVLVIPFHHVGMEGVVPQKLTGETIYKYPIGGNDVKLRVGTRIYFDDLIAEHEAKHGPLYKYPPGPDDHSADNNWKISTHYEKLLYSRITKRIELALKKLELESKADEDTVVVAAYKKLRHS